MSPPPIAAVNTHLHDGEFKFGGGRKARHAEGKLSLSRERKRRGSGSTYRRVIADRLLRSFQFCWSTVERLTGRFKVEEAS
jgi:hypothetical protein